jgi:hypothetical protein
MGRYQTAFPHTFNSAPGDQPASYLDQDFDAVNEGILTIRAQELSTGDDYNVVQDDEYSFFVCKGVTDFQVIPPSAPPPGFGFFLSNETKQDAIQIGVTICCTLFVGSVQYTNPVLIRNFLPNYLDVKGGLVQYDGNNYNFYPLFFAASGGGGGSVVAGTVDVSAGDMGVTITHGFDEPGLVVQLLPQWNTTMYQTAQNDTTVTFAFSNEAPDDFTVTYLVFFSS